MTSTVAGIDVTDAVRLLGLVSTVSLSRYAAGAWVDGRYVAGAVAAVSLQAAVQSYTDEKQALPEAVRTKRMIKVWSTAQIKPAKRNEGTPGDVITWDGSPYEVYDFWNRSTDGNYWSALCVAVDQ